MKRYNILLLATFVVCIVVATTQAKYVWPRPSFIFQGSFSSYVDQSTFTIQTNSSSQILQSAINRYLKQGLIFPFASVPLSAGDKPVLAQLYITVQSNSETLQLGVNESYNLTIAQSATYANLSAVTIYGAMRGLETFSQLVDYDLSTQTYAVTTTPVQIQDVPRFEWR